MYGFEITKADYSVLKVPERGIPNLAANSRSPKEDVIVVVRRRKEFEAVRWEFRIINQIDEKNKD